MTSKKIKIAIFIPKANKNTVLGSNGISLDSICVSCIENEECSMTGDYTLDATFLLDKENKLHENIVDEAILKVRSDGRDEVFRIVKNDKSTREIKIVAKQITITEQKQLWLDDVRPTNSNGLVALQHMYNNAVGEKEINIFSDINKIDTAYYQLTNLYKACYDCDQSFANRWGENGLETKRRQYDLYLNSKIGIRSNLSIREAKNLTGFNANTNIDTFVTRAIGKGFNGIKGHYIESSKKNNYARVNTKVCEYQDVKVKTSDMTSGEEGMIFDTLEQAQAELDKRVNLEFSENHIDDIKASYTINFVQLEKTEEYKNYAYLEKADVGDYVKVYVPSLEINIIVRVVRKKYNILTQSTEEMTLSNTATQATISTNKIIADLKKQYLATGNTNMGDYINAMLNAGMKDSNVTIRENEILIMDTKDINTAKNVWRWNGGALAHSSEGYYSKNWNVGITQNGEINANLITTGILSAVLIQSLDGNLQIDLSDSSSGVQFKDEGNKAIDIVGSQMKFYDWSGKTTRTTPIGTIFSARKTDTENCGLVIANGKDSYLSLGYANGKPVGEGTYSDYMLFDYYNITNLDYLEDYPIYFNEAFSIYEQPLFSNGFLFKGGGSMLGRSPDIGGVQISAKDNGRIIFFNNGQWTFDLAGLNSSSAYRAQIWYSTLVDGNFFSNGDIGCSGQKTRVVDTKGFGKVKLNAYESAECLFSDYGSGKINKEGECTCLIDPALLETINTNIKYQVFLTPYDYDNQFDNIQLKIVRKEYNYFVVKSNCIGLEFDWNLVAKQKKYETIRLNDFDKDNSLKAEKSVDDSALTHSIIEDMKQSDDIIQRLK